MSTEDALRHVFKRALIRPALTRPPDDCLADDQNTEEANHSMVGTIDYFADDADANITKQVRELSMKAQAAPAEMRGKDMNFTNQIPEELASRWNSDYYTDAQGPDYFADEQDPEEDYTSDYIKDTFIDEQDPEEGPDYFANEKNTERVHTANCYEDYFAEEQDPKGPHTDKSTTTLRNISHPDQSSEDRLPSTYHVVYPTRMPQLKHS